MEKWNAVVFFLLFFSFVNLFYGMTNGIFVSLFNFVHVLTVSYRMYIKYKKCLHTGAFTNWCFIYLDISENKPM